MFILNCWTAIVGKKTRQRFLSKLPIRIIKNLTGEKNVKDKFDYSWRILNETETYLIMLAYPNSN